MITLPTREGLFHTLSVGMDYKHFDQTVKLGTDAVSRRRSPTILVVATYGATFQDEKFDDAVQRRRSPTISGP